MTFTGTDGGARTAEADLWCSYAAVRTLSWLGEKPTEGDAVAAYLRSRQNPDGGYAWQRGLPSDVWATYYCAQALGDLGQPVPEVERLAGWLATLRRADGGFAMTPGQPADIWATYYAGRLYAEVLHQPVPDRPALGQWLASTQTASGGLTWQPGGGAPDTRACYYGALAWQAAGPAEPAPFHRAALVGWLRERQGTDGGFRFAPGATSCAWAAFRATRALRALGTAPRDPQALRRWIAARRLSGGGFERWPGFDQADVWACFSVVGALDALGGALPAPQRAGVAEFVRGCQLSGSGFTYRAPEAASDSLSTAAALLVDRSARYADWLVRAQLPYEGGVMYMPGRGAEVRCTLWAVEALRGVGRSLDTRRLARWLGELQNPDGGHGYWHGRGSDLVSTVSALETAQAAGLPLESTVDVHRSRRFLDSCRAPDGYRPAPGAAPTLVATAQAARALHLLGAAEAAHGLVPLIEAGASRLGGYAATVRGVPDLVTTYQAVLTRAALGLPVDRAELGRFLAKVRTSDGYAWSPLSRTAAGPLAHGLGTVLDRWPDRLPRLNL